MAKRAKARLPVLRPDLQIAFYVRLQSVRSLYLQEALGETVKQVKIKALDRELEAYVDEAHLRRVASFGLRGEVFFPVPCLIDQNPYLLGYYRLLYGLSGKDFYNIGPFGRFHVLETDGVAPEKTRSLVPDLCRSLAETGKLLVDGIGELSVPLVHELQLLTLGPQLRGSRNTELGKTATREVMQLIRKIVAPHITETKVNLITVTNASKREVLIAFAADPDIEIKERLPSGFRSLVSIEIKGGADVSNIHNRLGEAEKSHQKAKARGFFEFWTILRAPVEVTRAKQESPTTSHFFQLDRILPPTTKEHAFFRDLLSSILGIRTK